MSYVGDSAQEGQGFIDSLTGVYSLLAAEQSEKQVFHVHLSMLSMSVWAEKADIFFFLVLHSFALPQLTSLGKVGTKELELASGIHDLTLKNGLSLCR